ncbi:MAG: hypothetical protein GY909_00235 [Oligoflexia bacterium]|nr:hypothetical protein [Oligoflexia bacterium]
MSDIDDFDLYSVTLYDGTTRYLRSNTNSVSSFGEDIYIDVHNNQINQNLVINEPAKVKSFFVKLFYYFQV